MNETIKWMAVIFSLGGWLLVIFNLLLGLIVALIGSIFWVYVGLKIKEPSVVIVNVCFIFIQLGGIIQLIWN